VVCCVFAEDVPGSNATGPVLYDETVFADRQVCFSSSGQSGGSPRLTVPLPLQVTCVGHIIGAVVADTQLHAQRAAKAVRVQYEELPPVVTIQVRPAHLGPIDLLVGQLTWRRVIDRRPSPPSLSTSQSEPCRVETWRPASSRLTGSWRVRRGGGGFC